MIRTRQHRCQGHAAGGRQFDSGHGILQNTDLGAKIDAHEEHTGNRQIRLHHRGGGQIFGALAHLIREAYLTEDHSIERDGAGGLHLDLRRKADEHTGYGSETQLGQLALQQFRFAGHRGGQGGIGIQGEGDELPLECDVIRQIRSQRGLQRTGQGYIAQLQAQIKAQGQGRMGIVLIGWGGDAAAGQGCGIGIGNSFC